MTHRSRHHLVWLLGLFVAFGSAAPAVLAQAGQADLEALKRTAPKIFLDCGSCDLEYIKTEVPFVNYVRDRKEAQVHVLITTQGTGGGGREYTMTFLGQNEFAGVEDTVKYFSNQTDTEDDVRRGMVKSLKQGLMTYVARTPIASRIAVRYSEPTAAAAADKWDSWVFSLSGEGYFSGEESYHQNNFGFNFSANRITPDLKVRMGLSADYGRDSFSYEGQTIKSGTDSYGASGLVVKSLGPHWSAGVSLDAESSTYENLRFSLIAAPAVEYNLFPYAESTRRQLRFLYKVGLQIVRYRETTIFDKIRESLWGHSLSVTLDLKEKWGSITTSLSGSQYLHDLKKTRLNLFGSVQLNLVKGLNAYVAGGGSRIRDQLSLVKGDASLEEVLLRRRMLETGYNYFVMVGFSYTFGSIYTNVVNPRFGRTGGGGIHIEMN